MATVIFDLDGTLFQSHQCILTAVRHTLSTLDLPPVTDDLIMSLIGEKYADFAAKIAPGFTDLDRLWKIYTQSERDTIRHEARLFDGIPQMLTDLKAEGHKLALCSNGSMEYIELALHSTGIIDQFDLLVTGNDFPSKTEAAAFILQKLPGDCAAVVGDRFHDFEAAADNHLPSIGAAYGYCPQLELNRCTYAAYSAADVRTFVHQIEVFSKIDRDITGDASVRVLGVNGVDTSGKTSFADGLSRYLAARGKKTVLLHLDDFHHPKNVRNSGEQEIEAYINHAFDLELLIRELLDPIKRGEQIDKYLTLLNLTDDAYTNVRHFHIDSDAYVILEGVLLYRKPLEEYIDYKIFLDIDFPEVFRRAEIRDAPIYGRAFLEKYRNKYIPVQQWYLSACAPKAKSNLIVDNQDYHTPRIVP
jgi:phosphoglycolate phosphatase